MVPGDSHLESTAKQGNEITAPNVSRGLNMGHSSYVTESLRYIVSTTLSLKACLQVPVKTHYDNGDGYFDGYGYILTLRVNRFLLFKCSFTLSENERIVKNAFAGLA